MRESALLGERPQHTHGPEGGRTAAAYVPGDSDSEARVAVDSWAAASDSWIFTSAVELDLPHRFSNKRAAGGRGGDVAGCRIARVPGIEFFVHVGNTGLGDGDGSALYHGM